VEVLDAHVEAGEECRTGDFAASRAMAKLERAGRFGELEADCATETASMDHMITLRSAGIGDLQKGQNLESRAVQAPSPSSSPLQAEGIKSFAILLNDWYVMRVSY